jgi:hypothetical protein
MRSLTYLPLSFRIVLGLGLGLSLVACGSDPANVAGTYTLSTTNGDNACMFPDWTTGETSTAIPLVVTQTDADVSAELGGVAGGYVQLVLGLRTFTGTVDGDHIDMTLHGTRSYTEGGCTYTIIATADADVNGDFMTGTIVYSLATNHAADCDYRETCETRQTFNGNRPPSE